MEEKYSKRTDLLALMVFALFTLCLGMVLLTGAQSYRALVADSEANYEKRTAIRYLTTRVRQAERITVEDFGGSDALVVVETAENETYLTRIYCYDGALRELFSTAEASLSPADGEIIVDAETVTFCVRDGVLQIWLDSQEIMLSLRGKERLP